MIGAQSQSLTPLRQALYSLLPLVIPLGVSYALVRFSLAASFSRARIRSLENDESNKEKLIHILAQLERDIENAVIPDATIENMAISSLQAEDALILGSNAVENAVVLELAAEDAATDSDASDIASTGVPAKRSRCSIFHRKTRRPVVPPDERPVLTPLQHKIAASLNTLPFEKQLAFFPYVRNAHGVIVCRDIKYLKAHRMGEGVVKHWANSFVL